MSCCSNTDSRPRSRMPDESSSTRSELPRACRATLDSVQDGSATDGGAHRAVLTGSGRETRARERRATVTMMLHGDGDKTDVQVRTDLTVTGRPAQFGRGMMADAGRI
jgi:hypothetical protein